MVKERVRLVFSDLKANSYKYWDGELHDDGRVISYFGVVGAKNPQSKGFGVVGESFFRKKIREKERKGYSHAKVLIEGDKSYDIIPKTMLADIALSQINLSDDSLKPLIKNEN